MPDIEDYRNVRSDLVARLYKELIGPSPAAPESEQEERLEASPLTLYGAGILFPQKAIQNVLEDSPSENTVDDLDGTPDELQTIEVDAGSVSSTAAPDRGREDPALNLANEFSPSAMGITFCVENVEALIVHVDAGRYRLVRSQVPHPRAGEEKRDGSKFPDTKEKKEYCRERISEDISISLSNNALDVKKYALREPNELFQLHVTSRAKKDGRKVMSVMAVNKNEADGDAFPDPENAFFQVKLTITAPNGEAAFVSIDRPVGNVAKGEQESLELQYRHRRSFALGHGCAGDWDRDEAVEDTERAKYVNSASLPTYEVFPIRPREEAFLSDGMNLSMAFLAGNDGIDLQGSREILSSLNALCDDYAAWIEDQERGLVNVPSALKDVGEKHIGQCKECCKRMREGVALLESDSEVFLAFRLANRAMLMQQYHYGYLQSRDPSSDFPEIPEGYKSLPGRERKWRPFQLAFVLMNLCGSDDPAHSDRDLVDLIWFPTGGGKTEAYLGLAAFAICLRRLRNVEDGGTTVLMRYTLRLLTAQQFERASALILALDVVRQEKVFGADLGGIPITIGLWVGQGLSPNKRADARAALTKLRKPNSYAKNPFQILECPWCKSKLDDRSNLGYAQERVKQGDTTRTVVFRCTDKRCRWSGRDSALPISVIDEDLYDNPPTLLIGTVDKFAQLSWSDSVGRFFGIGTVFSPPSLIIQDELHLISGPLGTIVGLYEMALERLCMRAGSSPKIVASTATIRSAGEQCKSLYNREYFEFPPPGLKAGESYFAYEDRRSPGRVYVGVFGSGLKSHATAQVRTSSALMQGVMDPYSESESKERELKDPYGTVVWYFNSLRELGHALTLCTGDIPEHIKGMCKRLNIDHERRRSPRKIVELTSRKTADEIPKILRDLGLKWVPKPEKGQQYPVDVLLATNMISVGVDVARLGLMMVTGQPKSTSEYIQATSRVGRSHPGLVVTVYNQSKSRDRSHFERFVAYHQALYQYVEPTSVTPFASPARDRGLRGLLVALARLSAGVDSPELAKESSDALELELEAIMERVNDVDADEMDDARVELEEALQEWYQLLPSEYGSMGGKPNTTTLVYPFGATPDPIFQDKSWPMMTSMRNVDQTCEARVVSIYDAEAESGETD